MNASPDSVAVWELLRSIPDPEFDINIVDLGLIYSVVCNEGGVSVVMTLTTPSCPSGGWIHAGIKQALAGLPGAKTVNVEVVFDPQWTPEMVSESARRRLAGGE
jgi:metal-sulfur cluster biosynthetic enzyme